MGFSSRFSERILNATKKVLTEKFDFLDKTDDTVYSDIPGFYDENTEIVDPQTEMIISSDEITIDIKISDLPVTPKQNDELTRLDTNITYIVKDTHPDGQGANSLIVFQKIV